MAAHLQFITCLTDIVFDVLVDFMEVAYEFIEEVEEESIIR